MKIAGAVIDPNALLSMKNSPYTFADTVWLAFENQDLGHPDMGHLKFLAVGPANTIKRGQISLRLPDMGGAINWRYQLIGRVDLDLGVVVEE